MHTRPGLRNHALFAHAPRKQRLSDGIVDLVRSGMVQILAFEIDSRPAAEFSKTLCEIKRRFAPDVILQQLFEFRLKHRIVFRFFVFPLQLMQSFHQGLRYILSAVNAVMAVHDTAPFIF